MSNVDERIVRMQFDNTNFEAGANKAISILEKLGKALKFEGGTDGIESVKNAVDSFDMDGVNGSIEECSSRFSAFDAFVTGIFINLGNRVANFGIDMAKKLTVQPLMDGFGEYELQMKSVQTILSNAGDKLKEQGYETQEEQIAVINDRLDELNTYADKTIYNFAEMTRNIGTFTAAGVDLDTATTSIQGIANLAAASGSTSQQASTAMYQLSQAIAAGSVKLQDWNSVVNAGMGGELFQNALKRTARAHGIAVDEMIEKHGSFRESLQEGWITSEVLTDTLQQLTMSTTDLSEAEIEEMKVSLEKQGYTREDAEAILDLANNAEEAATKVRTWTQLWDTIGEALGSGWATTWRTVVGDFLEATDLFTHLSTRISGVIEASANARNAVLADWAGAGGRTALVDGIKFLVDAIIVPIKTFGEAFSDVFGISAEQLYNLSTGFAVFAEKLVPSKEATQFLYDALYNVFTVIHSVLGVLGNFIRIIANVAGVVWKLISPFVKLVVIIAGGVLGVIARFSAYIHLLSDYIEEAAYFITSHLGAAIDFIYGGFKKIISWFGGIREVLKVVAMVIPGLILGLGNFIAASSPVQKVVEWFNGLRDIVANKLTGAFGEFFKKFEKYKKIFDQFVNVDYKKLSKAELNQQSKNESQHPILSFLAGFVRAEDKLNYVRSNITNFTRDIRTKIEDLSSFLSNPRWLVSSALDNLRNFGSDFIDRFFPNEGPVRDKVTGIFNAITSPLAKLKQTFTGNGINRWKDLLIYNLEKIGIAAGTLKNPFEGLKTYFTDLMNSELTIPEKVGKVFIDAFTKVKEFGKSIPEILSNLPQKLSELKKKLGNIASNVKDKLVGMFSNLPSPSEIRTSIGGFIAGVKQAISNGLTRVFGEDFSLEPSSIIEFFKGIFSKIGEYASNITPPTDILKNTFSWIGGIFEGLKEFINLDSVMETIKGVFANGSDILQNSMTGGILFYLFRFIKQFIKLLNALSAFKMSKSFEGFGENLKDGLTNFGEGFTKFKQQTKAQAFQRIAVGLLLIAGALFVIAQIPSDKLMDVALTLGGLAVGLAALMVIVGLIAKKKDLDFEGIGKGIAGFGVAILAMSAAVWIFAQIPAEEAEANINRVIKLIAVLSLALMGIAKAGGDIKGAAATAIAMAAAITLLIIPIAILGHMGEDTIHAGGDRVGMIMAVLTGAIAAMEAFAKKGSSIAGAALAILALVAGITLMIIPIQLLGRMNEDVINEGGNRVGLIAAVLAGAISAIGFFGKHAVAILASVPAMVGLAVAISLMAIPIKLLAGMTNVWPAIGVIGAIAGILTVVILLVSNLTGSIGKLAAGMVAMTLVTVLITIMAGVVAGLALLCTFNMDGIDGAIRTLVYIILGLAVAMEVLSALGGGALVGMGKLSLGLIAFAAAMTVLALAIEFFRTHVDWNAVGEGLKGFVDGVVQMGHDFADGLYNAIADAPSNLVNLVFDMADRLVNTFKERLGIHSPSTVTTELGEFTIEGLINGIINKLGELLGTGEEGADTLLEGFDLANLPEALSNIAGDGITGFLEGVDLGAIGDKATEVINNFIDNIDKEKIIQCGTDIMSGLLEGLTGSVWEEVKSIPGKIGTTLIDGVKGVFGIHSPSTEFIDIGNNILYGLDEGLKNESILGQIGDAAGTMFTKVKEGIQNLPGTVSGLSSDAVNGFLGWLGIGADQAGDKASEISNQTAAGMDGVDDKTSKQGAAAVNQYVRQVQMGAARARTAAMSMMVSTSAAFATLSSKLKSQANKGVNAFISALASGANRSSQAGQALANRAVSGANGYSNKMHEIGRYLSAGLANGINDWAWKAEQAADRIVRAAEKAARAKAKVKSPSRVFMEIGNYIGQGFEIGILNTVGDAYNAGEALAGAVPDAFADSLKTMALDIDDLLDSDYNPVITPVINPAEFNYGLTNLTSLLNSKVNNLAVGNLNYTGELSAKLSDYTDLNKQTLDALANNNIDYDRLGMSVANALIMSGVHVEIDGEGLMGYLAGEVLDARRMYG